MKRFLLFTVILFTGCATIMTDKMQMIVVNSRPKDAKVTLFNEEGQIIYKGKTPCNIKLRKDDLANSRLTIEKDGYKMKEIYLGSKYEKWVWGNCCILILPIAVDFIAGRAKRAEIDEVYLILQPE